MKTKKKNLLVVIVIVFVSYLLGAYLGFPFAQMGMTSGNIGRAEKQHDVIGSVSDVKLAEKFETDTVYKKELLRNFGELLINTEATRLTLDSLKSQAGKVAELKAYNKQLDDVYSVAAELSTRLQKVLNELGKVDETKDASDISLQLSECINLYQIMCSNMDELTGFVTKTAALSKVHKLSDAYMAQFGTFLGYANANGKFTNMIPAAFGYVGKAMPDVLKSAEKSVSANIDAGMLKDIIAEVNPAPLEMGTNQNKLGAKDNRKFMEAKDNRKFVEERSSSSIAAELSRTVRYAERPE